MGEKIDMRLAASDLNTSLHATLDEQRETFNSIADLCNRALGSGKKILVCGNGGSAAEAQHFSAELVVRYKKNRKALPSISLTTDTSALTACGNDFSFDEIFARQVEALANSGDLLFCLSTSGNSKNILRAAEAAKKRGCRIVGLTGAKQNQLEKIADLTFKAKSENTARIQEIHLFFIHELCGAIENGL